MKDKKPLSIRYKAGTRVDVPFNPIFEFAKNVDLFLEDIPTRNKRIQWDNVGMVHGVSAESTWAQMLIELSNEFERHHRGADASWRKILSEYVALICQKKPRSEIWSDLKLFIHANIDVLSGWNWSSKKLMANSMKDIYRKDGEYYYKDEDGQTGTIHGMKTATEERLDFIANETTGKRGLVNDCLKLFTLTNIERVLDENPDHIPSSIRLELSENGHYTNFLHWNWEVKWPYQMRPLEWRPNDNFCDPNWLSNDLIAFMSEKDQTFVLEEFAKPSLSMDKEWKEKFGKFDKQTSFALESEIKIGEKVEAWIEFRGHTYRWRNASASQLPILIVPHDQNETDESVDVRAMRFLSHLSFMFERGIEKSFGARGRNNYNPLVSNPRRRGFTELVPDGYFQETKGKNQAEIDFAIGLFREGASSNSPFYRFLNFYKIIELAFLDKSDEKIKWINDEAPKRYSFKDEGFQKGLKESNSTVAQYFWDAHRNAIAHVDLRSGKDVVDPDDIKDHMRVNSSLPLIQDLAKHAIESGMF